MATRGRSCAGIGHSAQQIEVEGCVCGREAWGWVWEWFEGCFGFVAFGSRVVLHEHPAEPYSLRRRDEDV